MEIIKIERCCGCLRDDIGNPCNDCMTLLKEYNNSHDAGDFAEEEMTDQLKIYAQRAINEKKAARIGSI